MKTVQIGVMCTRGANRQAFPITRQVEDDHDETSVLRRIGYELADVFTLEKLHQHTNNREENKNE